MLLTLGPSLVSPVREAVENRWDSAGGKVVKMGWGWGAAGSRTLRAMPASGSNLFFLLPGPPQLRLHFCGCDLKNIYPDKKAT